jgi:CheY-like chemotaxis protein
MIASQERLNALHQKTHLLSQLYHPIVIVDDSLDDRNFLSAFLRSFVHATKPIVTLKNGQELLEYLAELQMENIEAEEFEMEIPDMVFLDLMMPGINGIEVLKAIRRQPIWADMPVTLITNSRDDRAIKNAEDAGANAFLPKPFTKMDVMKAMNKSDSFSSIL